LGYAAREARVSTRISHFYDLYYGVGTEVGQFIIGAGEQVDGGGLGVDEVYLWRARAWEPARERIGSMTARDAVFGQRGAK
jgi:hypothetical protein